MPETLCEVAVCLWPGSVPAFRCSMTKGFYEVTGEYIYTFPLHSVAICMWQEGHRDRTAVLVLPCAYSRAGAELTRPGPEGVTQMCLAVLSAATEQPSA